MIFDCDVPSTLLRLIEKQGLSILKDTDLFESFLRDIIPDKTTELYLLTLSLRVTNAFETFSSSSSNSNPIVLEKLKNDLEEKYLLKESAVNWIVEVWKYIFKSLDLPPAERKPFDLLFNPTNMGQEDNNDFLEFSVSLEEAKKLNSTLTDELNSMKSSHEKEEKTNKKFRDKSLLELNEQKNFIAKQIVTIKNQRSWLVVLVVTLLVFIISAIAVYNPFFGGVYVTPIDSPSSNSPYSTNEKIDTNFYGIANRGFNHNLELRLNADQRVWVGYEQDGKSSSVTLEHSGKKYLKANDCIYLNIGNAGGLNISVNGVDIGALGVSGEVIEVVVEYYANFIKITKSNAPKDCIYLGFN